jgi:multiple sugar transport system ATP-binding protein
MGFSLELKGASKQEKREKVQRAAEILDLGPLLKRFPRQLSGGQRQRVAMGRAIVRDPQVFLFDEPLSNLDAKLRVVMRSEIKSLHQRLGTTIIYVTHDQIEAMTMADRIAVMNGGVIEQLGTPLELYKNPANVFVATFIGSPAMNLVEGKMVSDDRVKRFVANAGGGFELSAATPPGILGKDIVLGIRPEHLEISSTGLEGAVALIEPMGSETQVLLDGNGQRLLLILRDRPAPRLGESVFVSPRPTELHFFEKSTEATISL